MFSEIKSNQSNSNSCQEKTIMSFKIKLNQSNLSNPSSSKNQIHFIISFIISFIIFSSSSSISRFKFSKSKFSTSSFKKNQVNDTKSNFSIFKSRFASIISLINEIVMSYILKQVNVQVYILIIDQIVEKLRIIFFTISKKISNSNLSQISKEFHKFVDIFNKKEVDKLSSHRFSDHRIKLVKDAKSSQKFIYNLSSIELEAFRKYVDEHFKKNFIKYFHLQFNVS